jgi:hypothetical protein
MKKVLRIISMVIGYILLVTGLGGLLLTLSAIGGDLYAAVLGIPLGLLLRYLSLLNKELNIRILSLVRDVSIISIYWTGSVVFMIMNVPRLTENAMIRLVILAASVVALIFSLKKLRDKKIISSKKIK